MCCFACALKYIYTYIFLCIEIFIHIYFNAQTTLLYWSSLYPWGVHHSVSLPVCSALSVTVFGLAVIMIMANSAWITICLQPGIPVYSQSDHSSMHAWLWVQETCFVIPQRFVTNSDNIRKFPFCSSFRAVRRSNCFHSHEAQLAAQQAAGSDEICQVSHHVSTVSGFRSQWCRHDGTSWLIHQITLRALQLAACHLHARYDKP